MIQRLCAASTGRSSAGITRLRLTHPRAAFADECLTPALVGMAHKHGYEATCTRDRGHLGMPDEALLDLAVGDEFVFVTNNHADFMGNALTPASRSSGAHADQTASAPLYKPDGLQQRPHAWRANDRFHVQFMFTLVIAIAKGPLPTWIGVPALFVATWIGVTEPLPALVT
jgi:hypothetical protein